MSLSMLRHSRYTFTSNYNTWLNNNWLYLSVLRVFPDVAGEICLIQDVVVDEVEFRQAHL